MALNNERFVPGNNQPSIEQAKERIAAVGWDDKKGIENFLVGRFVVEIGEVLRGHDLITSLYWTDPQYRMAILFANSTPQTSRSTK